MNKLTSKITKWMAIGIGALSANSVLAQTAATNKYNIELGNASPEDLVVNVINWILGILALVAVIMILIGGFKWMTAGGNEEKVEGAKKLLIAAVIGLVIILAAWGISIYAIENLLTLTGSPA